MGSPFLIAKPQTGLIRAWNGNLGSFVRIGIDARVRETQWPVCSEQSTKSL